MKRLIFIFILGILFFIPLSESQSNNELFGVYVGGFVLDENNQPLNGVQIVVKGTDIKTVSDFSGQYILQTAKYINGEGVTVGVPFGKQTLQYFFVGYQVKEINIELKKTGGQSVILGNVKMKPVVITEPIPISDKKETEVKAYSITIKDNYKFVFPNNPKYSAYNRDAPGKIIYRSVFTKQDEPVEIYDNTEVIYTLPFGSGTRNEKRILRYEKGSYTDSNDYGMLIRVFYDNRNEGKSVSLTPAEKEIVPGVVRIAKNRRGVGGEISIEEGRLNEDEKKLIKELNSLQTNEQIFEFFSGLWDKGYPVEKGWRYPDYDPMNGEYIEEEVNRKDIFDALSKEKQQSYRQYLSEKFLALFSNIDTSDYSNPIGLFDPKLETEMIKFFRAVPDRSTLERLDRPKEWYIFRKYWEQIRLIVGHIFYIEDKHNYYYELSRQLTNKNLVLGREYTFDEFPKKLELPITRIDLNTLRLEQNIVDINIDNKNKVTYKFGESFTRSFDPMNQDYSLLVKEIRFSALLTYGILYFPRINIIENKISVDMNYKPRENFEGKSTTQSNKITAYQNYKKAHEKESDYEREYKELLEQNIDLNKLKSKEQKIQSPSLSDFRSEIYEYKNFLNSNELDLLIKALNGALAAETGGVVGTVSHIFNIANREEKFNKIEDNLKTAKTQVTPIQLFKKNLELTDYNAFNALTLAQQFLLENRKKFNQYNVYIFSENQEDNFGAWYHFFGTAILSYAAQGYVSELENNEKFLKEELAQSHTISIDDILNMRFSSEFELLNFIQLKFIEKGSSYFGDQKEIYTLTTIFGEEVEKFTDVSGEVFADFRGAAFGRMLYSTINNKKLVKGTYWGFSIRDNYVGTILALRAGLIQELPWYMKKLIELTTTQGDYQQELAYYLNIFKKALCKSDESTKTSGFVLFDINKITGNQVKEFCLTPSDENYEVLVKRIIEGMRNNEIDLDIRAFEIIIDAGISEYPNWDKSKLAEEFTKQTASTIKEEATAELDLEALRKILEPEIDTSKIKTTDVLCTSYEDENVNEITGSAVEDEDCPIKLGYSEGYIERRMMLNGVSRDDAKKEVLEQLNDDLLYLIQNKFKPLKVENLKIYLVTRDEVPMFYRLETKSAVDKGGVVAAFYVPSKNTLYVDFYESYVLLHPERNYPYNPESVIYHEYVHAYQNQLRKEYDKVIYDEKGKYAHNVHERVKQIAIENNLAKRFLAGSQQYKSFYREGMSSEEAFDIISSKDLFDVFTEDRLIRNFVIREFLRFDFIPEYKEFFETLDFCSEYILNDDEEFTLWKNNQNSPMNGAYRPAQCIDIEEFTAYLLEHIKYEPEIVYNSINGEYGNAELYNMNLDLALKHKWITQEDYNNVVDYGKDEVGCDVNNPNLIRRAGKAVANALGKNTKEFCQRKVESTKENIERNNFEVFNEVKNVAETRDMDLALVLGIITQESDGRRYLKGRNGAYGLMQVLPDTAEAYTVKPYNLKFNNWMDNLQMGVLYFKKQVETFVDEELALAAYNAGPRRVEGWGKCVGNENANWEEIINDRRIKVTTNPDSNNRCHLPLSTKKYISLVMMYKEIWSGLLGDETESCVPYNAEKRAGKPVAGLAKTENVCLPYCKDDFILVTESGEKDCWDEDSLCVTNKCVKFEEMGWDSKVLENVKKMRIGDIDARIDVARKLMDLKSPQAFPVLVRFAVKETTLQPDGMNLIEVNRVKDDIIYTLKKIGTPEAFQALVSILKSLPPDDSLKEEIIDSLPITKSQEIIQILIKTLEESKSYPIIESTVLKLADIKSTEAVLPLLRLLERYPEYFIIHSEYGDDGLKVWGLGEKIVSVLIEIDKSNLKKIGESAAKGINNKNSEPSIFQELAVLINQLHDYEHSDEDIIRSTMSQNLDLKSIYYLIVLGGADLYTSSFESLYYYNFMQGMGYPIPRFPDFLNKIRSEIDPGYKYTLEFVLTLANYNKLKDIIIQDPTFFMDSIKKAFKEEDEFGLRRNGVLVVSTIQAIFNQQDLQQFKPEIEQFLLEQYKRSQKSTIQQAIFGYNIKLNKDKFSEKNKHKAISISNELPEILEPEVPKEWLSDSKLTAKLYFTQEGQLSRTRDQSFSKFFEFKIIEQKGKTSIMSVKPDSTLADGRSNGRYNGIELRVILTEDLGDVQEAVNDPGIDIVSHRGHSFSELNVFSPQVQSQQKKLIFLGGCGGFGRVCTIQRTIPKGYFVSDENIGQGDVNDRVLFYIMRSIAQRSKQDKILWSEIEQDVIDSYKKINSPFPSGIVFPHHKSLLLNGFVNEIVGE